MAGNYSVARYTLNIPHPYEDGIAEAWISTHSEGWKNRTEITYAITSKEDSSVIGAIGLLNIAGNEAELGYWICEPYWGKGFCTEAATLLIKTASEQWGVEKFWAIHLDRNPASGAVMKKSGMSKSESINTKDRDGVLSLVHRYTLSLSKN